MFEKISEFIKNNTGVTVAGIAVLCVLFWMYGCESQVQGIADPGQMVSRPELTIEVETFLSMADVRYAQLDQKDQLKNTVLEHALLWAQTGQVNPLALALALQGVIGTGAIVDNVTKRKNERKEYKKLANNNTKQTV